MLQHINMKDNLNRKIEYLRISLIDRCNLRCRYCMPEQGVEKNLHEDILTLEEILHLVQLMSQLGIRKVRLTGGEPLIRRNILTLIKEIHKIPSIENIALTTNGILLEDMADDLVNAGINQINISLDTLREDVFEFITRRKGLEKVLSGLEAIEKAGCTDIKINCVPIKGINEADIAPLAALAKDRNIKMRYIEMMPVGCAFESGFRGIPMNEVLRLISEKHGELIPAKKAENKVLGPAQYYDIAGFKGQIGYIDALQHKFCDKCNRVRLTSEGFLKLCLNNNDGVDLRTPLRNGADDDTLLDILKSTINRKPKEHYFLDESNALKDKRNMYQVGG